MPPGATGKSCRRPFFTRGLTGERRRHGDDLFLCASV